MGLTQQSFVASEGLPASVAVGKDVGEADAGDDLAVGVENFIQSAGKTHIAFDVGAELGEAVGASGLAVGDFGEGLGAGMQRAVDIGVFKFVGENAGDGSGVFAVEGVGPGEFEVTERDFRPRLISRTVCSSGRNTRQRQQHKRDCDFHTQIVT